jgi:6-pyruvoyltetrahydropterin/6-carboxytetrahydropterin synthase
MYTVTVRTHLMVAHSLPAEYFGPAAGLHGATYVVDVEFQSNRLNEYNVVIDMGLAEGLAKEVAGLLNYKNLDEYEPFAGQLTTTEFLAHFFHAQMGLRLAGKFEGALKVTLHESHVASASYFGALPQKSN